MRATNDFALIPTWRRVLLGADNIGFFTPKFRAVVVGESFAVQYQ